MADGYRQPFRLAPCLKSVCILWEDSNPTRDAKYGLRMWQVRACVHHMSSWTSGEMPRSVVEDSSGFEFNENALNGYQSSRFQTLRLLRLRIIRACPDDDGAVGGGGSPAPAVAKRRKVGRRRRRRRRPPARPTGRARRVAGDHHARDSGGGGGGGGGGRTRPAGRRRRRAVGGRGQAGERGSAAARAAGAAAGACGGRSRGGGGEAPAVGRSPERPPRDHRGTIEGQL